MPFRYGPTAAVVLHRPSVPLVHTMPSLLALKRCAHDPASSRRLRLMGLRLMSLRLASALLHPQPPSAGARPL